MKILSLLFTALIITSACTPTKSNRGNLVDDFRINELTPGISTQTNVMKSLGSPTTVAPFDDKVWYYMGQKMQKKGIFDPKVKEERVVMAVFNDEGILQSIEDVDSNRITVPKVRRKTHTGGNDVTLAEQLLGNIGKFNKNAESATRTAGGDL